MTRVVCVVAFAAVAAASESFMDVSYLDVFNPLDARELAPRYEALVARYATELAREFAASERFAISTREAENSVRCVGQIGRVEASMLYIAIREERPKTVVEVGALCGSSTRWMLSALEKNGDGGTLTTFDLFDYAPRFVPKNVETRRWSFHQANILEYVEGEEGAALLQKTELFFMDALHRNEFARAYTTKLFAPMRQRVLVFVHDIFSPFMLPIYKPCQKDMTLETIDEERKCVANRAAQFQKEHGGVDTFYGVTQPGGEGLELMSWLARTGRSDGVITFSIYAAPDFATRVFGAFKRNGLQFSQINNPTIFFELKKK